MYNTHTHTLHFHVYFLKQLKSEHTRELPSSVGNSSLLRDQKEHFTFYSIAAYLLFTIRRNLDVKSICTYCI